MPVNTYMVLGTVLLLCFASEKLFDILVSQLMVS